MFVGLILGVIKVYFSGILPLFDRYSRETDKKLCLPDSNRGCCGYVVC